MKYVKYHLTIIAVHLNSKKFIFFKTICRHLSSSTFDIFVARCDNFVARITSPYGCSEIETLQILKNLSYIFNSACMLVLSSREVI